MGHAFPTTHSSWRLKQCPRCNGDLFYVKDALENYYECLQCGCHAFSDDKFAALPKVDSRWRLVIARKA